MSEPHVITLGCRLNLYESEVMRSHAAAADLGDCVIINTCAVTGEAVRQARQTIRKTRRENPNARIIVTGCAAQTEPETFAEMGEVDHVVGNAEKTKPETYTALAANDLERVAVNDIMSVNETALHMIDGFGSRARAYVQVQNGCDHRCTFCIIPYGRGPSRSVPAGDVIAQIQKLTDQGYAEVVLTGVDLTSYGPDLPGEMSLGRLVQKILKHVPDLPRLRLSSIDQVEADEHLLRTIADEERLMPHLHLSLQAGDDLTLKRMKRRHLTTDAVKFCTEARRLRPDVVFGADLIAGFPTETNEMFENTLRHVDDCGLTYLHVFPFSPRKGTPAARMPAVNGTEIKARAARLRDKGERVLHAFLEAQRGNETDVLIERGQLGRTPQFAEVKLAEAAIANAQARSQEPAAVGSVQRVKLTGHDGQRLEGEIAA